MEHSREHENRMRQEFFQEVIDELESIQQMYDLDSCPKRLSSKASEPFQLVDNPLFEVVADWKSDNPLFVLNEGSSLVCHEEEEFDFKPWDPGSDSNSESRSQQGNDESTSVFYHLISPNIFSDFISFESWVNFLHQPLNSSWWSIYGKFAVRFSTFFIIIASMRVYADSMNFDVYEMVVSVFEQLISYIIHLS